MGRNLNHKKNIGVGGGGGEGVMKGNYFQHPTFFSDIYSYPIIFYPSFPTSHLFQSYFPTKPSTIMTHNSP